MVSRDLNKRSLHNEGLSFHVLKISGSTCYFFPLFLMFAGKLLRVRNAWNPMVGRWNRSCTISFDGREGTRYYIPDDTATLDGQILADLFLSIMPGI